MSHVAPYGSWKSPITADLLVQDAVRLSDPLADGDDLYWTEGRPTEGGRQVVVRRRPDGAAEDLLPEGFSARTLVHEYGGLCTAVQDGTAYFANLADQRLYRLDDGGVPEPLTPEPPSPAAIRYAGPVVTPDGRWLVCVREVHADDGDVVNDLVAVPTDGSAAEATDSSAGTGTAVNGVAGSVDEGVRRLAAGHDFYGSPAVSPDGRRLAWCTWDHPQMPWDGTELWEADLADGSVVGAPRRVAGGAEESVTQPRYSPAGVLHLVSDRTGWWNLYAADGAPGGRPLAPAAAEVAGPDWVFGLASYAFRPDGAVVATWTADGVGHLGILAPGSTAFDPLPVPYTVFSAVKTTPDGVVLLAASAQDAPALVTVTIPTGDRPAAATGGDPDAAPTADHQVVRTSRPAGVDREYLSVPEPFEFPTSGGLTAHALVYPPTNPDFVAPDGERPPLVVAVHGGPTSAASPALNYTIQFWTSRGFTVADVDYGGSSGYGRAYRQRLAGNWGVVDVADCQAAATALADAGRVDRARMAIHGGSAGGYTVLCAVTFGTVFATGASYYGVADVGALARDTHKFESRYTDGLVGPWPEARARYEERSPIFHTDRLATPLIIFQGLDDQVVPPNQAEMMVDALRSRGVPVAYLAYEGEQHGFRRAENIVRTAEAELYFYGRILGFTPADPIDPVAIQNLDPKVDADNSDA